mmetsp:Transcript_36938/g.35650  ORF Transcript_36938/g.35650 Transcript_36938/m.35650 type:complete len:124 (-) Transcript_36938:570-941(-)
MGELNSARVQDKEAIKELPIRLCFLLLGLRSLLRAKCSLLGVLDASLGVNRIHNSINGSLFDGKGHSLNSLLLLIVWLVHILIRHKLLLVIILLVEISYLLQVVESFTLFRTFFVDFMSELFH